MSNIQSSDLLIVGRGLESFKVTFSDLQTSVLNGQESSNDARYVLSGGDTMTGLLTLSGPPTADLHAASKKYVDDMLSGGGGLIPLPNGQDHQAGTLDERYVELDGDTMTGALILSSAPAQDLQAATKKYVDDGDKVNADAITALESDLSDEIDRAKKAEKDLDDAITQEGVDRQKGDSDLNTKIDALELDDLNDVNTGTPTEGQYLVFGADSKWIAKTEEPVLDNLSFNGSIDCTADAPPQDPSAGDYYFNTGDGDAISGWVGIYDANQGAGIVKPGDRVVFGTDDQWHIAGNVNDGGNVTLDTLKVVTDDASNGGELSYNNANGTFTFKPADVAARIPMDISSLTVLPAIDP